MVLHTYNPSTKEPEARGPNFKAILILYNEFQYSLRYTVSETLSFKDRSRKTDRQGGRRENNEKKWKTNKKPPIEACYAGPIKLFHVKTNIKKILSPDT